MANIFTTLGQVAGNAIRAIGHLGYLLYSQERNNVEFDLAEFFRLVVDSLAEKVHAGMNSVSDGKHLSWEQRSVARKHGRGACYSIALLFESIPNQGEAVVTACHNAVHILFGCVEQFWLQNEKFTMGAMVALRALDASCLADLAGRSGLIGNSLASCTIHLYEVRGKWYSITMTSSSENLFTLFFLHAGTRPTTEDQYQILRGG
jgi:hypothetical protein